MAESLRQLVASFVVQVDPTGEMKRGQAGIEGLKAKFKSLDAVVAKTSATSQSFFARLGAGLKGGIGGGFGSAVNASSAGIGKAFGGALSAVTSLQAGLAALAGGVVGSQIKALVDSIGGIGEEAAKLGVTNAEFQRLDVLAKQNATSVGALGTAFRMVGKAAVDPTKESAAAFEKLGVSVRNASGEFRSRQDIFFESAEALADISNENERATIAQQLFGRSAQEVLPLLSQGSEGIRAQRKELEKLPVVSDSAIAAADRLGDRWPATMLKLKSVAGDVLELIVIPLLEGLVTAVEAVASAVGKLVKWFNPWTHGVAALVVALSPLLSTMGALVALGGGWGALAKSVVGGLGKMVAAVAPALAAFLILEDLFVFFAGGKSLVGRGLEAAFGPGITKTVNDLRDAVKDLWSEIIGEPNLGRFKSLVAEIELALKLMIHNTLAALGIRDEAGLAGLEKYEAGQAERAGPARVPNASGGASNFAFNSATGGFMQVPSTIPTPGGPSAGGAAYGPPPPPTAAPTSTSITIINPAPGEGMKLAGQVKGVLERDRNSDIANVQ